MRTNIFSYCIVCIFCCSFLQGCGNNDDDGVWTPVREFTFSENDIIVSCTQQNLVVAVTNNKELRTWGFRSVKVSTNGNEPVTYWSEGIVDGVILDNFSQDCFDLTRKNDGYTLEVKLSENKTGMVRTFKITIFNGYDSGTLRIIQKAE